MKPLSEHVLREMPQEPVNNDNDINGSKYERLGQYGDQRYKYVNKPNQSREDFIKGIAIEIQKAKNRNNSFNIIGVYNDNNKKETIGYITYSIEKNYVICTISISKTVKNFIKEKEGVSVIDEMEQFILESFKDDNINSVHWTCLENNPIQKVYEERLTKYKPYIISEYDDQKFFQLCSFLHYRLIQ